MTLSRTFPLIGGLLLTALLAGCAGNAQTPANEDPAAAKAGTDDGHGHATDSKVAKAEAAKAPADADEGVVPLTPEQIKASGIEVVAIGRGGGGGAPRGRRGGAAGGVARRGWPAASRRRWAHVPRWRRP